MHSGIKCFYHHLSCAATEILKKCFEYKSCVCSGKNVIKNVNRVLYQSLSKCNVASHLNQYKYLIKQIFSTEIILLVTFKSSICFNVQPC